MSQHGKPSSHDLARHEYLHLHHQPQTTRRAGALSTVRLGEIGLCSVVAAELAYGVAQSGSARNRQALEMFLAPLTLLPFDDAAVWAYGDLHADLERRGTPIGALDTMIAAHALSQKAMLVTNNTREFAKVPGLQLDNWVPAG